MTEIRSLKTLWGGGWVILLIAFLFKGLG